MDYIIEKNKDCLCDLLSGFEFIDSDLLDDSKLLLYKTKEDAWLSFKEIFGSGYSVDLTLGRIYKIDGEFCKFFCSIKRTSYIFYDFTTKKKKTHDD